MKKRITKILGVVLALALLSSLAMVAAPVAAAPGVNTLGAIDTPSDEFNHTNVTILAFNEDGSTMYAAVKHWSDWALMKSTDGGFTWDDTTMDYDWYDDTPGVGGDIVDIVVSPQDDTTVYVAFQNGKIYKVADEGDGVATVLTTIKNEEGINASALYDIDVFYDAVSDANYILAGTDIDALVFKDAGLFEEWTPLSLIDKLGPDNAYGGSDDYAGDGVLKVAFAPDFAASSIIWAVYDTGNDNLGTGVAKDRLALASTVGTGTWNTVFDELVFDTSDGVSSEDVIPSSTYPVGMAFPTDYDSDDPYLYLALTDPGMGGGSDDGNIFLCVIDEVGGDSEAQGLLAENDDVCSVAVYGEVILAGATVMDAAVYRSDNGGDTFNYIEDPTGEDYTFVYMAPGAFNPDEGVAYAATSGQNSALSRSVDGGQTWTQIGLIDVEIDHVYDVAFLTQGAEQAAFLITREGMTRSLWRTEDITATNVQWERILCGPVDSGNVDFRILDVEVSLDGNAVMLYIEEGFFSGVFDIYKSTDDGFHFTHWRNLPDTDVEYINDWIVYDSSTIYCATDGGFYGTSRFGPATKELVGTDLASVALQPGFDPDDVDNMVLAVGDYSGNVIISTDKGENWGDVFGTGGTAGTFVAFDTLFADNGLIYYTTEGSLVGQALVDGNEVNETSSLTTELLDSHDAAARCETYKGIIVAPDNALYVLGGNEVVTTSYAYTATVSGTIEVAGENQQIAAGAVLQVVNDMVPAAVANITLTGAMLNIQGVAGGPFIDGEVLQVIGDSLLFTVSGTTLIGNVLVQGATSGATGYSAVSTTIPAWGGSDTTVSITSASMFADVNSGEITFTGVALINDSSWTNGETVTITGSAITGASISGADDTITLQGDDSGAIDTIELNNSFTTEFGTFDASEAVIIGDYTLVVSKSSTPSTSYEPTTSEMCRLLLHQSDNIWEYATDGRMDGFWYSEGTNILWTVVDGGWPTPTGSDSLVAFEDFLSGPVMGVTAAEASPSAGTATKKVKVSWTQLEGAEEYLISYDSTTDTYAVPSGTDTGDTLSKTISGLSPATTYTFKVRVNDDEPYQSRWSAGVSVLTGAQIMPPDPQVPDQGLQGAPLLPSFVWEAATGAVSYDFQLSTDPSFATTIISTNVTVTGYTYSGTALAYDLDHYWRVRSVASDGTTSAWCELQNFHTRTEAIPQVTVEPPPTPTIIVPTPQVNVTVVPQDITMPPVQVTVVPPDVIVSIPPVVTVTQQAQPTLVLPVAEPEGTPVYIWVIVAIGAILVIAVIVLIIRTRRVV